MYTQVIQQIKLKCISEFIHYLVIVKLCCQGSEFEANHFNHKIHTKLSCYHGLLSFQVLGQWYHVPKLTNQMLTTGFRSLSSMSFSVRNNFSNMYWRIVRAISNLRGHPGNWPDILGPFFLLAYFSWSQYTGRQAMSLVAATYQLKTCSCIPQLKGIKVAGNSFRMASLWNFL